MRTTYKALQANVRASHGRVMSSCWIAHRKVVSGLPENSRRTGERRKPSPPQWETVIDHAMRELGWL
ncbi:hypothetical protein B0G82_7333 [Paraburkholderia sp. BL17N1]|nr:hypothetical protein B0G82_7333 [Paraburkholderia sp. BL17N1]